MSDYDLTYLSLGAGVQSSALLVCSNLGLHNVPRADLAIFADTGDEPHGVYEYLWRLAEWSDIPVHITSNGRSISIDTLDVNSNTRCFIPAFTKSNEKPTTGMLMRKCTSQYKIKPLEQYIRRYLGYTKGQRVKHRVRAMIGISFDEVQRMKPSRTAWVDNHYPLVDEIIHRQKCSEIVTKHTDLPAPPRSACVFCPFHSDNEWRDLRDNDSEAWARAVEFDKDFRKSASREGNRADVFLHRSCVPLDEVDLTESDQMFLSWGGECEGMCGV